MLEKSRRILFVCMFAIGISIIVCPPVSAIKEVDQALEYADMFMNRGAYEAAIAEYDKVLRLEPENAAVWNKKGVALSRMDKDDEAATAYGKATALDPSNDLYWSNLGLALCDLKRYPDAIVAFDKAIAIKPTYAFHYKSKADALRDQGNLPAAIDAYNKAVALDPQYEDSRKQALVLSWSVTPTPTVPATVTVTPTPSADTTTATPSPIPSAGPPIPFITLSALILGTTGIAVKRARGRN
ncbi:MAG: tetratricopeptide repeat protein [Methanospirillum sp.]